MTVERPSRGFEHFEHTADVGIHAWGPSLEAAFEEAARGLFAHITDLETIRARDTLVIEATGRDLSHLLYHFLEEVRFVSEVESVLFAAFDVSIETRGDVRHLTASAHGEPLDAAHHGHYHEVKAITMHGLEVSEAPPDVRVVLDI